MQNSGTPQNYWASPEIYGCHIRLTGGYPMVIWGTTILGKHGTNMPCMISNYGMSRQSHFRSDQFGIFPDRICWYRRCRTTGFMRRLLRKRIMSFSSTHNGKSQGFCCPQITSWQSKIAAFQWRFLIFNRKYSGEKKYIISIYIYRRRSMYGIFTYICYFFNSKCR